jgi:hypothetical protein
VTKEQSEIYLRTGRRAEADRLMRIVWNSAQRDDQFIERYIKFLIDENRAGEAVQLCKRLPDLENRENYLEMLCMALKANGQKAKAIQLAKVNYIRLARSEKSYGGLKKFLEQNGVKLEVKVAYDTSQNAAFLGIVKRISGLKKTITPAQVAAMFPSKDKEKGWVSRSQVATCAVCKGNPWQIRVVGEELNSSRIKIYPFPQKTCITREEVEKIFGKTQKKPASWGMHGNGVPERLEYFDRDPGLRFDLSGPRGFWRMPPGDTDSIQHVTAVQIAWKEGRFSDPPYIPSVPPKPVPDSEIEGHLQEAEKAYEDGDFRRAATLTMKYFLDGHNTQRSGYERYMRRKKLLVDCYRKLGRNDIADAVQAADYGTLDFHVQQAFGYKTLLLPTMDEYMRERWRAIGRSWDGQITIQTAGWLGVGVEKENPHYSEFVKLIGPLKDGEERLVPPLPASLIDPTIFDPALFDSK